MNQICFKEHVERLKQRFGEKAFDLQFVQLIWPEVRDLTEPEFVGLVNFFLGSRTATRPPLVPDFKEGVITIQKKNFQQDLNGAMKSLTKEWPKGSLRRALDANPDWKGCKTAWEAVQVQILKNRVKEADKQEQAKRLALQKEWQD